LVVFSSKPPLLATVLYKASGGFWLVFAQQNLWTQMLAAALLRENRKQKTLPLTGLFGF